MTQQTDAQQEATPQAKAGAVIIPVTLFEQNCTLIWCTATKQAVVIDPGGDVPKILRAIEQSDVKVEKIWLTHGHIDHVGGAAELRDELKVPIEGPHLADKYLLDNVVSSGARFGMTGVRDFAPDRWLNQGDQVRIGELSFDILHCPGHSPGSVVFYSKELHFAHVGDHRKAVAARRRHQFCLRPRRRLDHRPGAADQSVPHRRDVTTRR
jgi:hydroxyacylglutathione hydrolase